MSVKDGFCPRPPWLHGKYLVGCRTTRACLCTPDQIDRTCIRLCSPHARTARRADHGRDDHRRLAYRDHLAGKPVSRTRALRLGGAALPDRRHGARQLRDRRDRQKQRRRLETATVVDVLAIGNPRRGHHVIAISRGNGDPRQAVSPTTTAGTAPYRWSTTGDTPNLSVSVSGEAKVPHGIEA
jgi:hypothetical protein